MATDWGTFQLVELFVPNFKPLLKVADTVSLILIIESWTHIELAIRSQCDVCIACPAVVHFLQHHAVGEKIQLRAFPVYIYTFNLFSKGIKDSFVFFKVIIIKGVHVCDYDVDSLCLCNNAIQ